MSAPIPKETRHKNAIWKYYSADKKCNNDQCREQVKDLKQAMGHSKDCVLEWKGKYKTSEREEIIRLTANYKMKHTPKPNTKVSKLTNEQLRDICRQRSLKIKGNKKQLIKRLTDDVTKESHHHTSSSEIVYGQLVMNTNGSESFRTCNANKSGQTIPNSIQNGPQVPPLSPAHQNVQSVISSNGGIYHPCHGYSTREISVFDLFPSIVKYQSKKYSEADRVDYLLSLSEKAFAAVHNQPLNVDEAEMWYTALGYLFNDITSGQFVDITMEMRYVIKQYMNSHQNRSLFLNSIKQYGFLGVIGGISKKLQREHIENDDDMKDEDSYDSFGFISVIQNAANNDNTNARVQSHKMKGNPGKNQEISSSFSFDPITLSADFKRKLVLNHNNKNGNYGCFDYTKPINDNMNDNVIDNDKDETAANQPEEAETARKGMDIDGVEDDDAINGTTTTTTYLDTNYERKWDKQRRRKKSKNGRKKRGRTRYRNRRESSRSRSRGRGPRGSLIHYADGRNNRYGNQQDAYTNNYHNNNNNHHDIKNQNISTYISIPITTTGTTTATLSNTLTAIQQLTNSRPSVSPSPPPPSQQRERERERRKRHRDRGRGRGSGRGRRKLEKHCIESSDSEMAESDYSSSYYDESKYRRGNTNGSSSNPNKTRVCETNMD